MTKQKFKVILVHDDTHYRLSKLRAELRMRSIDAVIADMLANQDTRLFLAMKKEVI